jgi:5-methylcytosine-specific restriction endonuclease McrA
VPVSLIPPPEPNYEQRRADALLLVAESALHHELDPGAPAERYHVILQVDSSGDSSLGDGTHVSAETSERLSCDASRTWIRHDEEGHPVEVSKKSRTIPQAIRRALLRRDQVCRFPGCERRFVQAHHIRHWAHGGPTVLSNLVLLCRYHHRAVHEDGYQITRHDNGVLTFHRPNGQAVLAVP